MTHADDAELDPGLIKDNLFIEACSWRTDAETLLCFRVTAHLKLQEEEDRLR
jgi:hypothetical protein